MKLTERQLRRIIREAIEEIDAVATDEEFEMIVTESRRAKLSEDIGLGTIAIGTVLGIFAYGGIKSLMGVAAEAAVNLVHKLSDKAQAELRAKARAEEAQRLKVAVATFADDGELADMFDQLASMRGTASSREISELSKRITSYVKAKVRESGHKVDPMVVRRALTQKWDTTQALNKIAKEYF